jgi:signal transduction histidine kinase
VCLVAACPGSFAEPGTAGARGLPFSRSYSFGDIGHVPRGSNLGFDHFGRLAVIHEGIYDVLNDQVWLHLAEPNTPDTTAMLNVADGLDGQTYFGGRSCIGSVARGADSRLHPTAFPLPNPPAWLATAVFAEILPAAHGIYFVSWNGVAFHDYATQRSLLVEVPRLSCAFLVGDRLHVSSFDAPLRWVDVHTGTLQACPETELDRNAVKLSTPLDSTRSIVSLADNQLAVFNGTKVTPWLRDAKTLLQGGVSLLRRLVDGRIALCVTGEGVKIFSPDAELIAAFTTAPYRNVSALANREAGVLWLETEDAVEKLLYGSPLSTFGQRLGLPVALWPGVASWKGQPLITTDGKIYRAVPGAAGETTRFEALEQQPPNGVLTVATDGDTLLVGNDSGLYELQVDGSFRVAAKIRKVAHAVMVGPDRCFVIGRDEISLLERRDGHWAETAPRIPGVRNPSMVHRFHDAVWIEMGGDGVARLGLRDGRLHMEVLPNSAWTKSAWVNVGFIENLVVLSSRADEPRRFYDESQSRWCEAPKWDQLLNESPYWIARPRMDEHGVIWAAHNEGLVRFTPGEGKYEMDTSTFDLVNDRYPVVRIIGRDDVWISAQRALYHVERAWSSATPKPPKPLIVSILDLQRNEELLRGALPLPLRLPFSRDSLGFRFFSGTDAWRRGPVYEFRLAPDQPWAPVDGSLLNFHGLREGSYRLQVRLATTDPQANEPAEIDFQVLPPWHRSPVAYALFTVAGLGALLGIIRGSNYLVRRRNRELERIVQERTRQLERAMIKLGEETRNAATLEERDRLANEIHDSVQQGLTGAMLQLDTTLTLAAVAEDLKSRLKVVRNMVAYARQEIQHAVWDMESPLLDDRGLGAALRNLTAFMNSGEVAVEVSVTGSEHPLGRAVSHHLLRIAQEGTTNALRHAQPRHIRLQLDYHEQAVELEIADDGIGFAPRSVLEERTGHLGLRGIRIRAKKMQGVVSISSAPGQGTRIRVSVPLSPATPQPHAEAGTHP